ncbi:MAG: hypothetical protein HY926_02570 [Elusimicrobia bacterium]|nr:hypothetical protein [Elusimicrobiota bacterium]
MQMLNRYFVPFALILILSAIHFSSPDRNVVQTAFAILALAMVVNWWFSKNTYRYIHLAKQMKILQVWLNYVWAVPLVYLLLPFWGPMWLLFVMAPITAALFTNRRHTLGMALVSAATMLGIYHKQGAFEAGWTEGMAGMTYVHAAFIVIIALFVYGLEQTALRLRDARLS